MIRITPTLALLLVLAACSTTTASPDISTSAPLATAAPAPPTTRVIAPATASTTTSLAATTTTAAPVTTTVVEPDPAFPEPLPGQVDRWVPEVLATHPHDQSAFTQGLVLVDHRLYESTGLYGQSTIREVSIPTGDVITEAPLSPNLFGEGLALVDGRLIQLTWQEEIAIVWTERLAELDRFAYDGQGWGLCDDGDRLVMSDGSAELQFRNRTTFELLDMIRVTLEGQPVELLNELECVDGLVFANVWKSTDILVIDPGSGEVTAVIDAAALDEWSEADPAAVFNGIAYDAELRVFYVTGKLWPTLYEVVFVAE